MPSTVAGFLVPTAEPIEDDDLVDALQTTLVGITAIPGNLVRPRWQPEPPQMPEFSVDWLAFGIVHDDSDPIAYMGVDGAGNGQMTVERDEILTVLLSFYGPHGSGIAKRFRDGMMIEQNRESLFAQNMGLVEIQAAITLPAQINDRWVQRVDMRTLFRRRTTRVYPIYTLVSAGVSINNEQFTTAVAITN